MRKQSLPSLPSLTVREKRTGETVRRDRTECGLKAGERMQSLGPGVRDTHTELEKAAPILFSSHCASR